MNEEQRQERPPQLDPAAVDPLPGTNEPMRRAKALLAVRLSEEARRRRN